MPEKDMSIIERFYTKWVKSLKNFEKFYKNPLPLGMGSMSTKTNNGKNSRIISSIDYGDLFLKCQKIFVDDVVVEEA